MRTRLNQRVASTVLVLLSLVGLACTSSNAPSASSTYAQQTATVGGIDVGATPTRIDSTGAEVNLTFESHSASFDADPTTAVTLEVNGTLWPTAGWDGDQPSGHHRKGTVRFTAAGPATGTATVTIDELAEPVQFSWTVGAA